MRIYVLYQDQGPRNANKAASSTETAGQMGCTRETESEMDFRHKKWK